MPIFFTSGPKGGSRSRRAGGASPPSGGDVLAINMQMGSTDGLTSSRRATVSVPVPDSAAYSASNLVLQKAGAEQQILTPVPLGNYPSGRPRAWYTEVMVAGSSAADWTARFDVGTRTLSPLSSRTYASWENATTHALPTGMMTDIITLGHAGAVVVPRDASYMCHCGAFGQMMPVADEATLGLDSALLAAYNADFDTWLRDYHWSGHSSATTMANITNTAWNGSINLSDPSTGYAPGSISPTDPPPYKNWREAIGVVGYSGGMNYYGTDKIFFQRFIRTGDLQYFWRACSYAEASRHYQRWTVSGSTVQGLGPQAGAWQNEGFGYCYLFTGNPDHLEFLRRIIDWMDAIQVAGTPSYQILGAYASDYGEPRPMERILDGYIWRVLCEDPANSATWAAKLEARLDQVMNGTAWTNWLAGGGTTYPSQYHCWMNAQPTLYTNTFMEALCRSGGRKAVDLCGDYLSSTIKATVEQRHYENVTRLYDYFFEGAPELYVGMVDDAREPSHWNGWDGSNSDAFPATYSLSIDITTLYIETIARMAAKRGDAAWTTIARRMFGYAVRGAGLGLGFSPPGSICRYQKQSRETYSASQQFFYWLSQCPPPGPVASDVVTQITIQDVAGGFTVSSLATGMSTMDATLKAQARNYNRLPQSNAGLTAVSSNTGIATASVNTTTGVLTITGVAAGTATITITDTPTSVSNTLSVVVANALFFDEFNGTVVGSNWDISTSGTGSVTEGSGTLAVVIGGGGNTARARMHTGESLTTAGTRGALAKVTTTDDIAFVAIEDGSGNGWAVRIFALGGGSTSNTIYAWNTTGTYGTGLSGGFTLTLPTWYRFRKNGSNLEVYSSTDGSTFTLQLSTAIGSVDVTNMKLVLGMLGEGGGGTRTTLFDRVQVG